MVKERIPLYKKLRTNSYKVPKPPKDESPECICKPDHPCVDDVCSCCSVPVTHHSQHCLNRGMLFECDAKRCPAGDKCTNTRIQKRQSPKLVPFKTDARGWGLKCATDLKKVGRPAHRQSMHRNAG